MLHFTIEDYQASSNGCVTCCCEKLSLKPGTTTRVSVGYAPWVVPIGELHCAPQFQLEQMETCPASISGNQPPAAASQITLVTAVNTPLTGDLSDDITDPEAQPVSFKVSSFNMPKHGILNLASDGTYTYTPAANYTGGDNFFVTASDGSASSVIEVLIAVGVLAGAVAPTPHIMVGKPVTNDQYFTVSFPITVSPVVDPCEVWRLTVLQAALDCNCQCYTRTDCFDIGIAKC